MSWSALEVVPRHAEPPASEVEQAAEWAHCAASPLYFLSAYGWLFNATQEQWLPFELWPAQAWLLVKLRRQRLVVMLKARQLGMTWLLLGYGLWLMLFRPAATLGIFSRTEDDAIELLDFRLKGMYARLPAFLRCRAVVGDNKTRWALSNGSVAMAFPTTGGRQYTFSFILVDEADHQPDLPGLMTATKPAIDAGGAMVLLSSVNKRKPLSQFKGVYRAARQGQNEWWPVFLSWRARPERDEAWYAAQRRDILARTGFLDDLHQEYPQRDTEALAPLSADKRIPGVWLERCYAAVARGTGKQVEGQPAIGQLEVYQPPIPGRTYVLGVDPAEGNPTSDDSAIEVLDAETGEECATLAGKFQPAVIAGHGGVLSDWYNGAAILVERNNHGHAVLLALEQAVTWRARVLRGRDKRPGWQSSALGKTILYDALADALRDEEILLHSFVTYNQVANIEGASLRAPDGQADDRADALALANVARRIGVKSVSTGGY
jgi:hypothetical protein